MQEEAISLYYKDASSDKEYHAQLKADGANFVVNFQYGRRGGTLLEGTKTAAPVAFEKAKKAYDKIVAEKLGKGYSTGAAGAVFQGAGLEQRFTGIVPQLLNVVDEAQVQQYIDDPDWVAQEKYDGHRRLTRWAADETTGINRKGLAVGVLECVAADLAALDAQAPLVIDGELMGESYAVFDVLEHGGEDLRKRPLRERLEILARLAETLGYKVKARGVFIVETARSAGAKQAMFDRVKAGNGEGVVFKRIHAEYVPGRPASGGNQLKVVLLATGTFRVRSLHDTKRSIGVEAFDAAGAWVALGNVTIPSNKAIPKVGDLVDVQYKYAFAGGSLFQPQYKWERTDLDSSAATMAQLKFKPAGFVDEEDES